MKLPSALLVIFVQVFLAPMCVAQGTALVTIQVKDVTGAAVRGTNLSVVTKSQEHTANKVARTDSNGAVALALQPGTYDLTVKAKAFRAATKQVTVTGATGQTFAFALQVDSCPPGPCMEVQPKTVVDDYCASVERILPNLHVSLSVQVKGRVLDATGDPFKNSRVEFRRYVSAVEQIPLRAVTTNSEGEFDAGELAAGEYRLLASPTRAFWQADEMFCTSEATCYLDITLQVHPTDLPDATCPIR